MNAEILKLNDRAKEKLAEARSLHAKALEDGASTEDVQKYTRQHDEAMKDFDALWESVEKLQEAEQRMKDGEAKLGDAVVDAEERKAKGQLSYAELRKELDDLKAWRDAMGEGKRPSGTRMADDDKERNQALAVKALFRGPAGMTSEERDAYNDLIINHRHYSARQVEGMQERFGDIGVEFGTRAQDSTNPTSTTGTAGGILIPTDIMEPILQKALIGPMLDPGFITYQQTADGRPQLWPRTDTTTAEGEWIGENAPVSDEDIVFAGRSIGAKILSSKMVLIPRSLEQDTNGAISTIANLVFEQRLFRSANKGLTLGGITNGPNGLEVQASYAATSAGTRPAVADWGPAPGNKANAVNRFDIIINQLLKHIEPLYFDAPGFRFMLHWQTLLDLRTVRDTQQNYIWQMGDVRANTPPTIWGKQYRLNQAMVSTPTADKTLITAGDFKQWITRESMMPEVLVLRERYAEKFQLALVAFARYDGGLIDTNAIKRLEFKA